MNDQDTDLQEGYLNLILPIIKDTLRAATIRKPKSQKSTLDKQAEQRKRILERMKKIEEPGVIFKVPSFEQRSPSYPSAFLTIIRLIITQVFMRYWEKYANNYVTGSEAHICFQ